MEPICLYQESSRMRWNLLIMINQWSANNFGSLTRSWMLVLWNSLLVTNVAVVKIYNGRADPLKDSGTDDWHLPINLFFKHCMSYRNPSPSQMHSTRKCLCTIAIVSPAQFHKLNPQRLLHMQYRIVCSVGPPVLHFGPLSLCPFLCNCSLIWPSHTKPKLCQSF